MFHEDPVSVVFRKCVYDWERSKGHISNQEPQIHLKICVFFLFGNAFLSFLEMLVAERLATFFFNSEEQILGGHLLIFIEGIWD